MTKLQSYPDRLPGVVIGLQHVSADMVTSGGTYEQEQESGYDRLRARSKLLQASVGDAIHQIRSEHPERALGILDSAISGFDRWLL